MIGEWTAGRRLPSFIVGCRRPIHLHRVSTAFFTLSSGQPLLCCPFCCPFAYQPVQCQRGVRNALSRRKVPTRHPSSPPANMCILLFTRGMCCSCFFGAAPGSFFFPTWWRVDLGLRLFLNEVLQRFWSNESRVRPSVLRVWVSVVCSYCSLGFHLAHVP